jgi:phospholipase/lecithinase/hemolysin
MKLRALFQAVIVCLVVLGAQTAQALPYSNFVVFGDSLSDPGNDFAITTNNGSDFSKPFPPPPYFQGHFSNGITAAEYVTLRSGLPTQNFAQGGATTGALNIDDGRCIPTRDCVNALYQLQPGLLSGVQTQVTNYLVGAPANIGSTLFFLQGGGNDFFTNDPALIADIPKNLLGQVSALVGAGAQHIALSNVPNIARTPFGLGLPAPNQAALVGGLAQVNAGIAQIWAAFPGIVIPIDSFGLLNDILDNAGKFGFANTTGFCRGLAGGCDGYAFFDDVHPTTALHSIVGNGIIAAAGIPEPEVLALWLIGGFGLLRRHRRR